jgi:hypothetical protein
MKFEYRQHGDYLIPNFRLPSAPQIDRYGQLRHRYLRKNKEPLFTALLMQDKLNIHLEEIDKAANDTYMRIFQKLKLQYGITEKLKGDNQLLWVQKMNEIHRIADEIVLNEFVYN